MYAIRSYYGVFLFWIAFVLTRPFGATFGDLLTKSTAQGGLDFGTAGSSLILASILLIFMIYSNIKEKQAHRQLALAEPIAVE